MPVFYDTHAHLTDGSFARDRAEVIERALQAGIAKIICIGTDLASSERCIQLSEQYPQVFATVGWQPGDALEAPEDLQPALRKLAVHPKVVAIGETGMDYYWMPSKKKGGTPADDERYLRRQSEIFVQQLELASELGLNCVVHERDALDPTLALLQPFVGRLRGVFHCFGRTPAVVERIVNMGCLVSFTGILTFKKNDGVRAALAATPMGRFMLETDCPYMAPEPHRKLGRSEPIHIRDIAMVAAQTKGCTLEELSQITCAAADEFFRRSS